MAATQDLVSAWFQMMAEATRGATEAQAAMLAFAQARTPEDVAQWMARYLPDAVAGQPAGAYSPETWWRLTGFVPRIRYLEQLERNELLRQRLDEAEATIARLRAQLGATGQAAAQVQDVTAAWQGIFAEMLKAQTDWLHAWTAAQAGDAGDAVGEPAP